MVDRELWIVDLGRRSYGEVLELQRAVAHARISGAIDEDVLLLVEHLPVITLGRSSKDAHLLANPAQLAARGVELFEVERGGDVTFHGPGQLVGYPIVDLKRHKTDLHWYLRQVEEVLIRALGELGIAGERVPKYTGIWTNGGKKKIASIGVHARDWVTWHGFALNVATELSFFDLIVPCGIPEVAMTSLQRETEREIDMRDAIAAVAQSVADAFSLTRRAVDPTELEARLSESVSAQTP